MPTKKNVHFKPTNAAELKSLFVLDIAIGCLKFPKVPLFWDKALCTKLFAETMGRDRFFQLQTNLQCVNKWNQLHSFQSINRKFGKIYTFNQQTALMGQTIQSEHFNYY